MKINLKKMRIIRPDDWHVHLRNGKILKIVLPYTSSYFSRAIIMPNLSPPITTIEQSEIYRDEILMNLPKNHKFKPLMTCYINRCTDVNILIKGYKDKKFIAAKFYVNHITSNVKSYILDMYKIFDVMQSIGMPLLVHGEVVSYDIDIFDQESFFIENILDDIKIKFPLLKIVLEHISTKEAAEYIISGDENIGATITPQHLILNRNNMLLNKFDPHLYCAPILKRRSHVQALQKAIKTGCNRFFIGTDTAPHIIKYKESYKVYAGIFNSIFALELYASIFDDIGALKYFENFCSINGPKFYGLPLNKDFIYFRRLNYDLNFSKDYLLKYDLKIKIPNFNYKLKWKVLNIN